MIWVQIIIAAVVGALLSFFYILLFRPAIPASDGFGGTYNQVLSPFSAFGTLFSYPIGVLIDVGITYLLAKAFGGRGTFMTQTYTSLLWMVPLHILSAVVVFVPFLGPLAAFGLWIYGLFLNIFNIRAVHHLDGTRASLSVLLPIIAIVVLFLACGMTLGLAGFMQHR